MNLTRFRAGAFALALALLPGLALAQGTPTYQSGTMIAPHNLAKITRTGQIQDAGGLTGDALGRGVNPFKILDSNGPGLCSYTVSGASVCIGHNSSGVPSIRVDGTDYQVPSGLGLNNVGISQGVGTQTYVSKAAPLGVDSGNCQNSLSPCLTIGYALGQQGKIHQQGGSIQVNLLGSGDWPEDIFVNGTPNGSLNFAAIPNIGSTWPSQVIINGNGSSTTLSGSGNLCATVAASNYGIVGVANLTISSNKTSCQGSLFAQMGGMINVFGGVTFATTRTDHMHSENAGSSIQLWQSCTVTGSGSTFMDVGGPAQIISAAGSCNMSGSPTFSTAVFNIANGGNVQFNQASGVTGVAIGPQFFIQSNGSLLLNTPFALPGSTTGIFNYGGRLHIPGAAAACIGGSGGCQSSTGPTGLGSTGTAAIGANSGNYSGQVVLSPSGSGIATAGAVTLGLPGFLQGYCSAGPASGTSGNWLTGAVFTSGPLAGVTSPVGAVMQLFWSNAGGAPTGGQTLAINYNCNTGN